MAPTGRGREQLTGRRDRQEIEEGWVDTEYFYWVAVKGRHGDNPCHCPVKVSRVTPAPGRAPPSSGGCWPLKRGAASGGQPYSETTTEASSRLRDRRLRWMIGIVSFNICFLFRPCLVSFVHPLNLIRNHWVFCFERMTRQSWKIWTSQQIWTPSVFSRRLTSCWARVSLDSLTRASISWPQSGRGSGDLRASPMLRPSEPGGGRSTHMWSGGFLDRHFSRYFYHSLLHSYHAYLIHYFKRNLWSIVRKPLNRPICNLSGNLAHMAQFVSTFEIASLWWWLHFYHSWIYMSTKTRN